MSTTLLVLLSASLLCVMHHSLKWAFRLIEKAHEHLRESDRLRGDGELVKGKVS